MECWSVGVLECWSVGVLECWRIEFQNGELAALRLLNLLRQSGFSGILNSCNS
jgi:hypothetical protein